MGVNVSAIFMTSIIIDQIFNFFAVFRQVFFCLVCYIRLLLERLTKMTYGKFNILVHISKLEARL